MTNQEPRLVSNKGGPRLISKVKNGFPESREGSKKEQGVKLGYWSKGGGGKHLVGVR